MYSIYVYLQLTGIVVTAILIIVTIIGFILPSIKLQIEKRHKRDIQGKWYEYHWSNPYGEFKWVQSSLELKRKRWALTRSIYKIRYTLNESLGVFLGVARSVDRWEDKKPHGDILFKVKHKGLTFVETIYFRYNLPKNVNDLICGVWMSYNFTKNISSGISFLSKTVLPPERINEIAHNHFVVEKYSVHDKDDIQ